MLEKEKAKERIVYLDGRFVPESEAKISIFDTSSHNAYMVHEAIRTFNGLSSPLLATAFCQLQNLTVSRLVKANLGH